MIAKITGGGSFGGALAYLMQQKKDKEREGREKELREREQDRPQERAAAETPSPPRDGLQRNSQLPAHHRRIEESEHAPAYQDGARHRIIGGNMSGETRHELNHEFVAVSGQRPDIQKPVHHVSISAGEKDRLTVEQWREIAALYVERMGYQNSPHVIIQHRDGKRDHIHILASRVNMQGEVVKDWQNKLRAEKVMREVEEKYGLERVKPSREVERAAPKRGEIETFKRTGELSVKLKLQGHVEQALRSAPTATEFIARLERSGVAVIPNLQSTGRVSGISFQLDQELMKGSDLGRGFSWSGLQARGLDYQPERDRSGMMAARERAAAQAVERNVEPAFEHSTEHAPGRAVDERYVTEQVPHAQQEVQAFTAATPSPDALLPEQPEASRMLLPESSEIASESLGLSEPEQLEWSPPGQQDWIDLSPPLFVQQQLAEQLEQQFFKAPHETPAPGLTIEESFEALRQMTAHAAEGQERDHMAALDRLRVASGVESGRDRQGSLELLDRAVGGVMGSERDTSLSQDENLFGRDGLAQAHTPEPSLEPDDQHEHEAPEVCYDIEL